jgi:hypothetical protein
VKFSVRQLFASAGGAVLAAVIASLFGVKGTIIGVAIGSAAATMGTALVAQSIERGHEAVKQVAVRVPDRTTLMRRLGATSAVGQVEAPPTENAVPSDDPTLAQGHPDDTAVVPAAPADDVTMGVPIVEAATQRVEPITQPVEPITQELVRPVISRQSIPWRAISATAAVVFVLSLGTVTVIELIAGHPIADIFSHVNSGTSLDRLFNPGPPAPTTSTTTTTSTSTTTTSTSTTTTSSTTTTTLPGGSTTTTAPGATTTTVPSSTTTSGVGSSTTTTSIP